MNNPANVYQQQIKDIFSRKVPVEVEYIFKVVELILYQTIDSSDIFELYQLLGMENFSKVVNLVDGRPIKIPKRKALEDAFLAALLYYEREIMRRDWKDIKRLYPELEINSIKNSLTIKSLNDFVHQKMDEMLRKGESHDGKV